MSGDALASGARSATFQVHGNDEFTHDLKTLSAATFIERYGVSEDEYRDLLAKLLAGEKLIPPHKAAEFARPAPQPDAPKIVVREAEKPQYRASALGDEVLVIRVEEDHSAALIIPPSAKAKSEIGRVVAVGPDVKRCKDGELVLFDRFAAHGKEIELVDDQGVARMNLLLNDADVLLRLERVPRPSVSEPN